MGSVTERLLFSASAETTPITYAIDDIVPLYTVHGTITTDGTIGAFSKSTKGVGYLDAMLDWN